MTIDVEWLKLYIAKLQKRENYCTSVSLRNVLIILPRKVSILNISYESQLWKMRTEDPERGLCIYGQLILIRC